MSKSVRDFLHELKDAGFEFVFTANDGERHFVGASVMQDDGKCELTHTRLPTKEECMREIKRIVDSQDKAKPVNVKPIGGSYKGK